MPLLDASLDILILPKLLFGTMLASTGDRLRRDHKPRAGHLARKDTQRGERVDADRPARLLDGIKRLCNLCQH